LTYIKAPEAFAEETGTDEEVVVKFNNGSQRFYFPLPTEDATDE
jgi:hypothetical protein